jgi:hypothetical protein
MLALVPLECEEEHHNKDEYEEKEGEGGRVSVINFCKSIP